jgi:hypothetical protein
MHTEHDSHGPDEPAGGQFFTSRNGLILLAFLGIAAFYLLTEHTAHVYRVLPYLLLAACPLLHLFMHGGHGSHGGREGGGSR